MMTDMNQRRVIFCLMMLILLAPAWLHAGVVQLPKTGQTVSFSSGDDGTLRRGVSWPIPRFIDHGNGEVTDQLTGLVWAKNANLMSSRDPGFGPDLWPGYDPGFNLVGLVGWYEALDYIKKLNTESYLGHSDWRLPNRKELRSLIDYSQFNPALPSSHPFIEVQQDDPYWSSNKCATNLAYGQVWIVYLRCGSVELGSSYGYVWPVRGGQSGCSGASGPFALSGTVTDASKGTAVSNATVTLSNGAQTTTDSSGQFSFTGLEPSNYQLLVTQNGYLNNYQYVDLTCGNVSFELRMTTRTTVFGPNVNSGIGGDPVNTATGSYFFTRKDLELPGRGFPLIFERTYNSQDTNDGPLGFGWTHRFNASLTEGGDGAATIRWGDGKLETWTPDGSGGYKAQYGVNTVLAKEIDNSWRLTAKDGSVHAFAVDGALSSLADRNGNAITLTYTGGRLVALSDAAGRVMALGYDGNGRITSLTDPLGRIVIFAYDGAGNLVSSTDPDGHATTYSYDADHQLLTVVDPRGNTVVSNTYDNTKRVVASQRDAKLGQTSYSYDEVSHTTTLINPLEQATVHEHDELLRLVAVIDPRGYVTRYVYDAAGNRTEIVDPAGNKTLYSYDERGNVLTKTNPMGNVTTLTYDADNNPLTRTDALGNQTTYAYDAHGNLLSTTDPLGNATTATYNAYGQVLTRTDARGAVTTSAYDGEGNLVSLADALGSATTYTYDAAGRRLATTDALGHTTTLTYDGNDRVLTVTDALGGVTTSTYDGNGNRVGQTDALGHTMTFVYDVKELLTTVTDPLGHAVSTTYDALDRKTAVTDANGNATTFAYDASGNPVSVTDPLGNKMAATFDNLGRKLTETNPLGQTTTFAYDVLGQVTSVTDPLGNVTQFSYDPLGRKTGETNALGQTTAFTYDALGQLTKVVDANNGQVAMVYDAAGNRTSQTDPNGHATTYVYDLIGRLTQVTEPLGGVTQFTYDPVGNILSRTDAKGQVTTYAYDAANRLTGINYSGNSVTFSYDLAGRRTSMTDALGTTTFVYDASNRLISHTDPFGKTVGYGYDANGNRTSLTYPGDQVVSYTFDANNRLKTITDWLNRTTTYNYDTAGRLQSQSRPNGTAASYLHDAAGRLSALAENGPGGTLASYSLTLDALGNTTAASEQQPLTPAFTDQTLTYSYDADDRLLSDGTVARGYDANGNTISRGSDSFVFDAENRLQTATLSGVSLAYAYDGLGHRLSRNENGTVTRYVLDLSGPLTQVLAETDGGGNVIASYVYGLGLVARIATDGTATYYHYDPRGSTVALTDASGVVTDSYAYHPFGQVLNQSGASDQVFRYLGRFGLMDEGNDLIYIRARYYDPAAGRFLTKDARPGQNTLSQTLNRYTYALNNPIRLVDISGYSAQEGSISGGGGWGSSDIGRNLLLDLGLNVRNEMIAEVIEEGLEGFIVNTGGQIAYYTNINTSSIAAVAGTAAAYSGTALGFGALWYDSYNEAYRNPDRDIVETAARFSIDTTVFAVSGIASIIVPGSGIAINASYQTAREDIMDMTFNNSVADFAGNITYNVLNNDIYNYFTFGLGKKFLGVQ